MPRSYPVRPPRPSSLRGMVLVIMLACPLVTASAQLSVVLVPDGISVMEGAALAAASLGLHASTAEMPVDIDRVNGFDRLAMFGYSRALDVASDVTQYAAAALPLALALAVSQDQAFAAGVIYFEVMTRAFFAKNTVKFLVPRVRPWIYLAPGSGSAPEVWEGNDSFPSGHSTVVFAAAAFGITTAVLALPSGSPWLLPFAAAEAGLAAATASLRVLSGMHFMTDVIAGAALGSVIGVVLPLAHSSSWTGGAIGKSAPLAGLELPILSVLL